MTLALIHRGLIASIIHVGSVSLARDRSGVADGHGWRNRFLAPEGRVVDTNQGGISNSEGQGYGLLLAQAFELIVSWTASHLAIRQDALTAWRWDPHAGPDRSGETATDGDLFRA